MKETSTYIEKISSHIKYKFEITSRFCKVELESIEKYNKVS